MVCLRRLGAAALALILFLGPAPRAAAESGGPPQETAVSDWAGLKAALSERSGRGGRIRLESNIEIDENFDYVNEAQGLQPVTVDCGEYTIYIKARTPGHQVTFSYTGHTLTFAGEGGEDGLLHVCPGGWLGIDSIVIQAGSGNAVVQENSGVLVVDRGQNAPVVEGAIRYADTPTLVPGGSGGIPACAAPEETATLEELARLLSATAKIRVNWKGSMTRTVDQPVEWELAAVEEDLAARRRTVAAGRYVGPLAAAGMEDVKAEDCGLLARPQALVVFPVDGAAIRHADFQTNNGKITVAYFDFFAAPGVETSRVLVSQDEGASWAPAEEGSDRHQKPDAEGIYDHTVYPSSLTGEPWFLVELVYPNGRLVHTDVIACDAGQARPVDYIDGHRGGGEPLLPGLPAATPGPAQEGGVGSLPAVTQSPTLTPLPSRIPEPGSAPAGTAAPTQSPTPVPAPTEPPADPIVPQGVGSVQPPQEGQGPPVPAQPAVPAQAAPGVLAPAAQVALGCAAVAVVGVGAAAALNPGLLKKLLRLLKKK